jgi:hypothetical protein
MMEKKVLIKAYWEDVDCDEEICSEIQVYGDTYPIKETLKKLGFRWNPNEKIWTKESSLEYYITPDEYDNIVAELRKIADVDEVETDQFVCDFLFAFGAEEVD